FLIGTIQTRNRGDGGMNWISVFQFLIGTIKTQFNFNLPKNAMPVSIPHRYDPNPKNPHRCAASRSLRRTRSHSCQHYHTGNALPLQYSSNSVVVVDPRTFLHNRRSTTNLKLFTINQAKLSRADHFALPTFFLHPTKSRFPGCRDRKSVV